MSTQKSKKGFTLIELMVVIVIIGILAAIAIPKLFGMSAKAKASEVAPAAGTWLKMLTAYSIEKDTYGSFKRIGYIEPKGSAFEYKSDPEENIEAKRVVWKAENISKLNECPEGTKWEMIATFGKSVLPSIAGDVGGMKKNPDYDESNGEDEYILNPDYEPSKDALPCEILTPSFVKVATTGGQ